MKSFSLVLILSLLAANLASCAHQSKVTPSTGHIDGQSAQSATVATAIPKPVISTAYVPPPKPKAKEQTYSVVVNEVPVKEILFALARESKLNVDIHPGIQGRVTLNAVDQTLPAILERLAKQVDLTYRFEGNVLTIAPDEPVLRSYKVDYVNMSRDTTGSIGAAAEIATAGRAASTGSGTSGASGSSTSGTSGGTSGSASLNGSRTKVESQSQNRFWDTLIKNLQDILAETDKEVIIARTGSSAQSESSGDVDTNGGASASTTNASVTASGNSTARARREEARAEYRTLFAATVIANKETGVITVRATSKQHEKVQEFLDKVIASANRQVLIEATVVEVKLNDTFQAGIDWSRLGNGFTFSQTLGGAAAASGNQFVAGYSSSGSAGDIAASLRLLRQFGDIKVVSSPKLMVLNNQTAILKVVNNFVYFLIDAQTTTNNIAPALTNFTTTPQTVPVGLVMSVTPQINQSNVVNLSVRPTLSRITGTKQDPNPNLVISTTSLGVTTRSTIANLVPEIQVSEMESMLQVHSGDTAVLGGLMQDDITDNSDNVPGLYKIPLFGKLFSSRNASNIKTELVVFLRPVVISQASLESDELQSYKRYLPAQQLQQKLDESAY
jgi:general secretion pathway protein D